MTAEELRSEMAQQLSQLRNGGRRIKHGVVCPTLYGSRNGNDFERHAMGWGFLTETQIEDPAEFRELLCEGGSMLRLYSNRSDARRRQCRFWNRVRIGTVADVKLCR